jgi:hypothetical protein
MLAGREDGVVRRIRVVRIGPAGPALAYATLERPRVVSIIYGVSAMFFGGLLVHFGQGPVQIEMHFYFFALIAMLAVFGNPLVIVAAAVTVALHHLLLWFIVPESVFNYDAPVWVVAEITVESEPGKGTTLRMSFPLFAMAPELASPPRRSLLPRQIATA